MSTDRTQSMLQTGVEARKTAGYPELLKELMMQISWEIGAVVSTRVGNPPRIDIPVKESTKASDIKAKTAPSSTGVNDLFIVSPARGTIIVDQEVFGKTGSSAVPKEGESGYNHLPYPTTLRELLKYVDEGKLKISQDKNSIFFEAVAGTDFHPVATGYYDHGKLKFKESEKDAPSLTYSINKDDLDKENIEGIFEDRREKIQDKLSPWKNTYEINQDDLAKYGFESNLLGSKLDKLVPLNYRHGDEGDFKPLKVVAKNNAIVIGDDDTLLMAPPAGFVEYIKEKQGLDGYKKLMTTMGNFNANPTDTVERLWLVEKLLFEYNIKRLEGDRAREKDLVKLKNEYEHCILNGGAERKNEIASSYIEQPNFALPQDTHSIEPGAFKFGGIDSCGNDGMSAFELMISIKVNKMFKDKTHIEQFIQHPPELRNLTVPSDLKEEKAMHIWNGRFILTSNESELVAFYAQQNVDNPNADYHEKFPLLSEQFVEISPVWISRVYSRDENNNPKEQGGDKWWPIIAIQIKLGQESFINQATLEAYKTYIASKPSLNKLDSEGLAVEAEKVLSTFKISQLSDMINPNLPEKDKKPSYEQRISAAFSSVFFKPAPSGKVVVPKEAAANDSVYSPTTKSKIIR